jgi:hypothetical protein
MIDDSVLTLVENRLAELVKAVEREDRAVADLEGEYATAVSAMASFKPNSAAAIGKRLTRARLNLAAVTGRQQEAEAIWTLLKYHMEER